MDDMKWQMIALMVVVVVIFTSVIVHSIVESSRDIGYATAGLEECSDMSWDGRKLWVKDCKSYIEAYQNKEK